MARCDTLVRVVEPGQLTKNIRTPDECGAGTSNYVFILYIHLFATRPSFHIFNEVWREKERAVFYKNPLSYFASPHCTAIILAILKDCYVVLIATLP